MKDDQRKAMYAKIGKKPSGIKSTIKSKNVVSNDDYWKNAKGVKNRYNPDGYVPVYGIGDKVFFDEGGETPSEGEITFTRYEPDQAFHKINGKYRPESSIHKKIQSDGEGMKTMYDQMNKLRKYVENHRPSVGTPKDSKKYKDWAKKVNELGEEQKRIYGVRLVEVI